MMIKKEGGYNVNRYIYGKKWMIIVMMTNLFELHITTCIIITVLFHAPMSFIELGKFFLA